MDLVYDVRAQHVLQLAKATAKTARFGGNMFKRIISTSFSGICQTCNNLQPFNHERTFGQPEPPWEKRSWADRESLIKIPTLGIEDIPAKDILASRQTDQKTGKPKSDCPYCRLLCDVFDHFFGFETDRWDHHVMSGLPFKVGLMIKQGQPIVIQCWNFEWDASVSTSRVDLEMYTEAAIPSAVVDAPTISGAGVRSTDSSSQECMTFIRQCMDECLQQHPRCRNRLSASDFTPTRLVYIGDHPDDIRLFEAVSTGTPSQWAALSHCWGGGDPFALKTDNLTTLLADIPTEKLPETFKDAIQVCRNLGIQYLWIDSLCIIQDDKQDWEREAAQMGMVYSHALVVISGASSKNPDTPFLGPRNVEDWLPRKFDFKTPRTGYHLPVTVRRRHMPAAPLEQGLHEPPYTNFWSHNRRIGPLHKRSWCFQESQLSTRNLDFSSGSIIFECQTQRRSEDQLPPYPQLYSSILGKVSDGEKWRMIVQQYTSRKLTFASDKLPAVSGIASLMPQASRIPYLAGLWQESLLVDLMWQVNPAPKEVLVFPPDQHTAPSWSWASLNRAVVYNPFKSFTPLASLVHADITLKSTAALFGAVTHASLTLRARMRPCKIRWKPDKYSHRAYYTEPNGTSSEEKHFVSDGLLTALYPNAPPGSVYASRASWGTPYEGEMDAAFVCLGDTGLGSYSHVGLLVVPSARVEGAWERVGNLMNARRKCWEGGREVEVVLV